MCAAITEIAQGCPVRNLYVAGKGVEMRFKVTKSGNFCSVAADVRVNSRTLKWTALAPLLALGLSTHSLSFALSTSQNQMHFQPVQSQSSPVLTGSQVRPFAKVSPFSGQRQTHHLGQRSAGQKHSASQLRVRSYNTPATGNVGFLGGTQVPAGGALDYFLQYPTIEGDFNGDGKPDVATIVRDLTNNSLSLCISIVLSNGDGTFMPPVLTPVPGQEVGFQFVVGDVNGDHKDDIVIVHQIDFAHPTATMVVLLSNGDGTFSIGNTYSITSNSLIGGTLADVNADGRLDLIVADQASSPDVWMLLGNGDGTFGAAASVPLTGMPAMYMAFADLNGDGLLDIAQISTNGELTVYLATSPVAFAAPSYYSTIDGHLNAGGITVGDLNGDGRPEVVTPNNTDENITIYMNNGDGTFQAGVYVAAALAQTPDGTVADVWPSAVTIADTNGDGKADIISTNQGSADITVLLGNGDGTFRPTSIGYAVGGFPETAATIADFDGDGIPDLMVSDFEFSLVYLKGHGDGTFRAAHNYYSPIPDEGNNSFGLSIASGDFNGDGYTDFVTSNCIDPSSGITVFLSRPDGTLLPGVNYGNGGGYMSVAVADFDKRGKLDIAVADMTAGVVRIFTGNGDGTFTAGGQFMTDSSNALPEALVVGDFNHDGYPDVAVLNYGASGPTPNYNVAILLNDQAGGFVLSANYPLSGRVMYPTEISAGSLKGNGNLDLVVPLLYKPAIAVFSGNGDGTFQTENDIAVDDVASDVAIADLNGDGKADLAVTIGMFASTTSGIDVLLGNGDGTFQAPQLFSASIHNSWDLPFPRNIKVVDVDGDGKLDLVYTNSEFGTLGVLFGQGNGSFSAPSEVPVGGMPWGLSIADLNLDGAPDAVIAGDGFAGVTVLLNANGTAVAPNYTLSSSASSVDLTGQASATLDITLTPLHSYSGTVSFACSGLPSQLSCTFTPQSVQLNGTQQVVVGLSLSSGLATATTTTSDKRQPPQPWRGLVTLGTVGALAFVLVGSGKKQKNLIAAAMVLPVLCLSFLFTSCGTVTPRGTAHTYVVQVNATGVDGSTGRPIGNNLSLKVTLK